MHKLAARWQKVIERNGGWPLWLVVILGISVAFVFGSAAAYLQAEVLTAPDEPVWSTFTSAEIMEIVRSSTFALGAIGGAAALLLAYRRQMLNQASYNHEREKHEASHQLELDKQLSARVAGLHDRYSKCVEQLADSNASIRLGAVHAIDALAADWLAVGNHRQRQVCVNLLCSYLNSLDQTRSENSILSICEDEEDAEESVLRAESAAAGKRLWGDKTVRRTILETLSDMLVADHTANRDPVAVDLQGAAFDNGLNLRGARLARLPLNQADLQRRDLTDADLTGANLSGAMLGGARLCNANLTDADLSDVWCDEHTLLNGANLSNANLTEADMKGVDLHKANLSYAECAEVNLRNASLRQATLVGTVLGSAKMNGVDLTEADLTGAQLPVILQPKHVRGAILARGCWVPASTSSPKRTWKERVRR